MKTNTAKELITPRDGIATFRGKTFYLVDAYTMPGPGDLRLINAVDEDASEIDAGYLPMTLLALPSGWKRGEEVKSAVPNGEYDWIMCEQKGFLTPPRGYRGRRCHDC